MNKKANTILFMIAATALNVVMMVVIFLVLVMLYAWIVPSGFSSQVGQIIGIVLFLGSIALTYFIYHRLVKWMSKKWNLDDYFDPIFGKRGGAQRKNEGNGS